MNEWDGVGGWSLWIELLPGLCLQPGHTEVDLPVALQP